jgi:MFS family permease
MFVSRGKISLGISTFLKEGIPLRAWLNRYDRTIWIRVIGTALTQITSFMIRPFLMFYLYSKLDGHLFLAALVVSLQPLASMIVGLFAGEWADRAGRKPVMAASLAIQAVSMAGFVWADSVYAFAGLTALGGIGQSLFHPAANAQIADLVPENRRAEVYALLHMAFNAGAAAGPMLGLFLFRANPALVFGLASASLFLFFAAVVGLIPETKPAGSEGAKSGGEGWRETWRFREHIPLFLLTLLCVPMSLLYGQADTNLPIHLKDHFDDYQKVFAVLMTVNGTLVLLFQMAVAGWTERFDSGKVLTVAFLLLTVVSAGYGWAGSFAVLIAAEVAFTLAEMLGLPHTNKVVARIAPEHLRGRYFAVFGLQWGVGRSLGPAFGSAVYVAWGGDVMFYLIGALCFLSAIGIRRVVDLGAFGRERREKFGRIAG